jgi:hypothetical protein
MNALLKQHLVSAIAGAVLISAGCSQPTKPSGDDTTATKEAAAPVVPVTAKTALWPMYTSARNWATDIVILKITNKEVAGFKNEAGKAAMWEVTFASPSRQEYRVYSYAIAAQPPDIYKGVVVGRGMPWSGPTRDAMPIPLSDFNVDSDTAYNTAATDAAPWLKKNPEKTLSAFELWNNYRFQAPVWFLKWGDKKSGYIAFVNATTGKLVKSK